MIILDDEPPRVSLNQKNVGLPGFGGTERFDAPLIEILSRNPVDRHGLATQNRNPRRPGLVQKKAFVQQNAPPGF